MEDKKKVIALAKNYLRGEDISNDVCFEDLYQSLVQFEQYGYAAEILLKKIADNEDQGAEVKLSQYQDLAENIYKDSTLSSYFKFDKAINTLKSFCDLEKTKNSRTLGIAGAVYRSKWKFDHQFHNLLQSRAYYKKGYLIWKNKQHKSILTETECINTAVNYANLNELIVIENLEGLSETCEITAETLVRFETAQKTRKEIVDEYLIDTDEVIFKDGIQDKEKLYEALAEAFFGLRMYSKALYFIKLYTKDKKENWEIKSFSKQIYNLANYQNAEKYQKSTNKDPFQKSEIIEEGQNSCLTALNLQADKNGDENSVKQKPQNKVGIGLSGGGFRASLFHIGVLAALAEKDKLKDIEVISCVSGGSIIGAFYYLKIKQLFESKRDEEIAQEDYIQIVKEIEKEFLDAVQKNIRMRLLTNFFKNVKMWKGDSYSRSNRLAELYEEYFYNPLLPKNKRKDSEFIHMSDLFINPFGNESFKLNDDNWKRMNKVPQLILNATAVNTGHNWQFTASWMGEPPTYISDEFDVKPRLRRMYYENAPEDYQKFRLGYAVAASSCVPVLFQPLVLKGLYKNFDLELIDGGVHDNQGIASILEQECNEIIVSDASAQMPDNAIHTGNAMSLFFRVDTILQERLREIQLLDLKSRKYTSIVARLSIVHLKNGLEQLPVSWIDCTDVNRSILYDKEIEDENALLKYGIMKKIQKGLSEVRTDLDSFNDLEAYALMYSGYKQMTHESCSENVKKADWSFLKITESCTLPAKEKQLAAQLKVSGYVPFKIIRRSKALSYTVLGIGGLMVLGLLIYLVGNWDNPSPLLTISISYDLIGLALIVFLVSFLSKFLSQIINIESVLKKKAFLFLLITIGWIFSLLYIAIINPCYNRLGKVK
ncbi:patatin-like phospholipase family protein [Flavobacterium sp. HJJ]|uniref:patatin-like phospholipase family protein n=1 Tax=Flavobacterium sp. HJJ TaxID=2783792 RepID=UPI00188CB628|nr:patatin-like phospholipase family protein [Flavobacterium sp. HJJ]MBF4473595.1 patatin-like phospholipase family protein [Flavobacterium sp. HJJ]